MGSGVGGGGGGVGWSFTVKTIPDAQLSLKLGVIGSEGSDGLYACVKFDSRCFWNICGATLKNVPLDKCTQQRLSSDKTVH